MSVCVKIVIKIEIEKKIKKSWYIFFVHIAQPYSEATEDVCFSEDKIGTFYPSK